MPEDLRQEVVSDLASGEWRPECYDLFRHNCNHFANELSLMLTGQGIPVSSTSCSRLDLLSCTFAKSCHRSLNFRHTLLGATHWAAFRSVQGQVAAELCHRAFMPSRCSFLIGGESFKGKQRVTGLSRHCFAL